MKIQILKSKLHRAIITEVHLDYEGSCAIDEELLQAASINEYEMIHIYNLNNGNRFTTYAIKQKKVQEPFHSMVLQHIRVIKMILLLFVLMQKLIKIELKNISLNLFTLKKTVM